MQDKILFVDDEIHILDSMKRQLRKRFEVVTALSGNEALEKFKTEGPFSVIVSDMRMPQMDGIELLQTIKDMYPDTIRMMLTGNADQQTAIEAVNKGQIFRFLNKPCPISILAPALALALRQYRLVTAERDILDKTLKGSVKVLSELLGFASPTAFSSGLRTRSLVVKVAQLMDIANIWQLEMSALLSQIGCVPLPQEIINKVYSGEILDDDELEMYSHHPETGARMLESIPRLESVARIIRFQLKNFEDFDPVSSEAEEVDLCAQILRAVLDFDLLLFQGKTQDDALRYMRQRELVYNPDVLNKLSKITPTSSMGRVVSLKIQDVAVGMIVEEDIFSANETLLAPKGQEITMTVLQGLKNFARQVGVKEPVRVKTWDDKDES